MVPIYLLNGGIAIPELIPHPGRIRKKEIAVRKLETTYNFII